jgi:broad specificity phosphatase PhoE
MDIMSSLFLVRHGQASFLEPDYDKLSPKGEAQARMLGEYWARHRMDFDHVYSGTKVRQMGTARIAREAAGASWEISTLPEFDEFPAEAVMNQGLPGLLETDCRIRTMHQNFLDCTTREEKFRTFQRLFEVVIAQWAAGTLLVPEIEPWPDFCRRVYRGLDKITAHNGNQRVAVFSSGGPVGVAMQRSLDLSTQATLKTAWMVRNGSWTEFLFSHDRFTLSAYNAVPHLTDAEFITYR